MIEIDLRSKNRIVTLSVPGKAPIKARSGSPYFYNSMELVCVALGACFGNELITYCSRNNVNPSVFESISITMENFIPKIVLQHPKDMRPDLLADIASIATQCSVSRMLDKKPEIMLIENTIPVEILTDETKKTTCCGH